MCGWVGAHVCVYIQSHLYHNIHVYHTDHWHCTQKSFSKYSTVLWFLTPTVPFTRSSSLLTPDRFTCRDDKDGGVKRHLFFQPPPLPRARLERSRECERRVMKVGESRRRRKAEAPTVFEATCSLTERQVRGLVCGRSFCV